jgi:hypothetical protein
MQKSISSTKLNAVPIVSSSRFLVSFEGVQSGHHDELAFTVWIKKKSAQNRELLSSVCVTEHQRFCQANISVPSAARAASDRASC